MKRTSWFIRMMCKALLAAAIVASSVATASAADLGDINTSLAKMPADTAMYFGTYRGEQQWEIVKNSNAWKSLVELPLVQHALDKYEAAELNFEDSGEDIEVDLDDPWVKFRMMVENPQVQALLATLGDMFSEDAFMMVGPETTDTMELLNKFQYDVNKMLIEADASGDYEEYDLDELRGAMMIKVLDENLDLIKTPKMLIGFKLDNTERAQAQINLLGGIAAMACMAQPQLAEALDQVEIGDGQFITFTLKSSMIPWEEAPIDDLKEVELKEGQVDRILEKAKTLKICLAIGIIDDYLMVSIADSTDYLAELGKGELLIDSDDLKPLAEFADKQLTSIGYVSEDFMKRAGDGRKSIRELKTNLEAALLAVPDTELDEETKEQLLAGLPAFTNLLLACIPEQGKVVSCSMITEQGIEKFGCVDVKNYPLDGSKPLSILSHVGGNPMMMIASRKYVTEERYELLAEAVETGIHYAELLLPKEMSKKEKKKFDKFMTGLKPLLSDLDRTNRELLIPALADGQAALVIDNKLSSTQFCPMQPKTDEPMPMLEPALVLGVSDAEKLLKSFEAYHEFAIDVFDLLKTIEPDEMPEALPEHDLEYVEAEEGKIWTFPIPEELGVCEEISPCYGLSETTAVLALSVDHAKRILSEKPQQLGGVLENAKDQPMAMAMAFQNDALLDTIKPWVQWAIEENVDDDIEIDADFSLSPEDLQEHVRVLFDVLGTMKTTTLSLEVKDGQATSRSLQVIQDIE